jgi:hypothetical protein
MSIYSTQKPSRRNSSEKPKKPYPTFPLTPHPSGAWQKKIRGRIYYFGRWGKRVNGKLERIEGDGWEQALALYKAQADDLHAGRTPRVASQEGLIVGELCNRFLTAKLRRLESGELSPRSFQEYRQATDLIITLGKTRLVDDVAADDFESLRATMSKRWGPLAVRALNGRFACIQSPHLPCGNEPFFSARSSPTLSAHSSCVRLSRMMSPSRASTVA